MLSYKIIQDPFAENPLNSGEMFSFNKQDHNYVENVEELIDGRRYFELSCYRHSGVLWFLKGTLPSCRFDTVEFAGLIIADSEEEAQSMLDVYNAWLNGDCWGWEIIHDGKHYDSCWGYYSYQDAEEAAKERMEEVEEEIIDKIGKVLEGV